VPRPPARNLRREGFAWTLDNHQAYGLRVGVSLFFPLDNHQAYGLRVGVSLFFPLDNHQAYGLRVERWLKSVHSLGGIMGLWTVFCKK